MPLNGDCDLIVLSHLRWDFVFQRPQHLMTRFARHVRVFFFEEPLFDANEPTLEVEGREGGVYRVIPHVPQGLTDEDFNRVQRALLDGLIGEYAIAEFVLWYYTPMSVPFTDHLEPCAIVYDCMDELSLFKGAPPKLLQYEDELLKRADVVFTGGYSLYEYKKDRHPNIHAIPSSIDFTHFARARHASAANGIKPAKEFHEPQDQVGIPHPRIGFFGVIDERMDLQLIKEVAEARTDWHLVILGPVVKIDPSTLPRLNNIHYPGQKGYEELPSYIAGWDVAMLPFARVDSTRFISPTKTPEYLAAGKPVVSTPIQDVVRPYGELGLVSIAQNAPEFIRAIEFALQPGNSGAEWQRRVDQLLSKTSWDKAWQKMSGHLEAAIAQRDASSLKT